MKWRAVLLLAAAAVAGVLAVTIVSGYSSSVAGTYGELKPVVVLARDMNPGRTISPRTAGRKLEVRRVPERFLPAAAVARPEDAVGLELATAAPAGSYLTGNLLRAPGSDRPRVPSAGKGRSAVEIAVSGAGALAGTRGKVDVLVTSEPSTGGSGRTRIAARRVPLISVGRPGASDAGPGLTQVTLGLTRPQAVRLVQAESFARRMTVLPRGARP
ncbi:MAG: SAF domain-containing protein [Actinomycetota bacterium]|nr:SAF domain-containing protein [Actinomycetota bacterium]